MSILTPSKPKYFVSPWKESKKYPLQCFSGRVIQCPRIFMFHEGTFLFIQNLILMDYLILVSNTAQIRYSTLSCSYLIYLAEYVDVYFWASISNNSFMRKHYCIEWYILVTVPLQLDCLFNLASALICTLLNIKNAPETHTVLNLGAWIHRWASRGLLSLVKLCEILCSCIFIGRRFVIFSRFLKGCVSH